MTVAELSVRRPVTIVMENVAKSLIVWYNS